MRYDSKRVSRQVAPLASQAAPAIAAISTVVESRASSSRNPSGALARTMLANTTKGRGRTGPSYRINGSV